MVRIRRVPVKCRAVALLSGAALFGFAPDKLPTNSLAQYSAFQPAAPSPVYQTPPSYADYFNEQVRQYQRPPISAQQYIIDRYFYHRPTLSPYLNLTRRSSPDTLNNYYRYVLPEIERRQQQSETQRPMPLAMRQPVTPPTPPPSSGHYPLENPYFNQFYNFGGQAIGTKIPPQPSPLPKLFP